MCSSYYFNPLFTIFILSFVQFIDLVPKQNTTKNPETRPEIDIITTYDSSIHCKFQANRFNCGGKHNFRYYYDVEKNTCEPFDFGNCLHPYNAFTNLHSCTRECRDMSLYRTFSNLSAVVYCRLQPEFGNCNSYFPRFYYDVFERSCKGFSFSGCGGNQNRFELNSVCMDTCMDIAKPCGDRMCFN